MAIGEKRGPWCVFLGHWRIVLSHRGAVISCFHTGMSSFVFSPMESGFSCFHTDRRASCFCTERFVFSHRAFRVSAHGGFRISVNDQGVRGRESLLNTDSNFF
jgi:hypothetical protein